MQRITSVSRWDRYLPLVLIMAGGGITAIGLAADHLSIGGLRGIGPNQVSLALSGFAVLLAGTVLISSNGRRHLSEWLLVGATVIAVVFAADLLVVNGLPEFGAKHVVVASIALSVLSIGAVPISSMDRRTIGEWLGLVQIDRLKLGKFLSVVVPLGLLVLVIRQFRLENQAFYHNLMLVTFYGFIVHYFLPIRYQLPFFLLLSLAAMVGILGLVNGAWLIGIGLALIGICHLPIPYIARISVLLVAGAAMVALRAGWFQTSWLDVIWPVLASMFMFRLIVYMYDLKHSKATPTLASTLSYFFLLPNVVFPFFPVVDYATFRRTYYNEDRYRIYQTGVQWMLRGVIQLILYRYVNYYLVIAPGAVTTTTELARYLIANFALYIRISGQFHLIIGLLHLFGFNLPPTHYLYFLATSFTDLWRRINIYWKDFMLKVFYYPTFFRIRHWGATSSLVLATFFVFFLTWFFHAYQWFWLRGSFLFTAPDILFWFILALLVVVNTVYEARRGRKRSLGQQSLSLRWIMSQALRAASTFTMMAILWSLWSSPSIRDWLSLMSVAEFTPQNIGMVFLIFLTITVIFAVIIWIKAYTEKNSGQHAFFRSAALMGGSTLLLLIISNPTVYGRLDGRSGELISDLTTNRLSDEEAALLQQGYYEDLTGVEQFNSQLWEIYTKRPSDWPTILETEVARQTDDNLITKLVPSKTIYFHGAQLSTNRWGMRDQDYERIPPPDTYRIAVTGPSFVTGIGVANNEVFEWILEERLNREHAGGQYDRYELLNFGVPGYSAIQDLLLLEEEALSFQPDALFFIAHQREEEAVVLYLADRISVEADFPYDDLIELAEQAGVEAGMTKVEAERRLRRFQTEILSWTYRRIAEISRSRGVQPVWIFMPTLEYPLQEEKITHLSRVAEESGFVVVNLSPAYENQDPESLVIANWDKHPNAKGHRLIADELYQALREMEAEIPLGLSAPANIRDASSQ